MKRYSLKTLCEMLEKEWGLSLLKVEMSFTNNSIIDLATADVSHGIMEEIYSFRFHGKSALKGIAFLDESYLFTSPISGECKLSPVELRLDGDASKKIGRFGVNSATTFIVHMMVLTDYEFRTE